MNERSAELVAELQRMAPFLDQIGQFPLEPSVIEYDCPKGHVRATGLYKTSKTSVAYVVFDPDTLFPEHINKPWEYLIVIEGSAVVTIPEISLVKTLEAPGPGKTSFAYIEAGQRHWVESCKTCKTTMIAMTIPGDAAYPNAPEEVR